MIALVIIPLRWADPDSRKVLVHDDTKPSDRFTGEDGEGFYSVVQACAEWCEGSSKRSSPESGTSWRHWFSKQVAPSDLPLYNVAYIGSQLVGVYIEHFSAPTDADDHFVETPLLSLPAVPEDTYDPDKHQWEAGDWFEVSHFITEGDKERGKGPFQVKQAAARGIEVVIADPRTEGRTICWYYTTQIRPCAAPESTTDTQTGPCAREGIEPIE